MGMVRGVAAAQSIGFDSGKNANLKEFVAKLRKTTAESLEIKIPPPAGIIETLDPKMMNKLQALAAAVATVAPVETSDSHDYMRELQGCQSTGGSPTLSTSETNGYLERLFYSSNKALSQSNQLLDSELGNRLFVLDVNLKLSPDGTQYEESISVGKEGPSSNFTIALDGQVRYGNPEQLDPANQDILKKALAFWSQIDPATITTDSLYGNLLNKNFQCAP